MTILRFLAVASLGLLTFVSAAQGATPSAPVHPCDELAANPLDPQRRKPGVSQREIKGKAAVNACEDAIAVHPDEARFQFQLARAYRALDRFEEAVAWYRRAADQGYAGAQNSLGVMYMRGLGVRQSCNEAVRWYGLAAAQGYAVAERNIERAPCVGRASLGALAIG